MTRLHDRVHVIHEAIRRGENTKVLFHLPPAGSKGWRWWAAGADTVHCQKMVRDFPESIVGYFTPNASFEHLSETMADEEKGKEGPTT